MARAGGQLLSCGDPFDFGAGDPSRSLGYVPKPSNEIDHLDNEYKGQNGALGTVSQPDVFGHGLEGLITE
jgi:hypothetical protein